MLSKEDVIKLSKLARIQLTDAEVEKFQKDLSAVLEYIDELQEVDVAGLEEVSQVTGLINVQREDLPVTISEQMRVDIMSNAPDIKDGFYKVKTIL